MRPRIPGSHDCHDRTRTITVAVLLVVLVVDQADGAVVGAVGPQLKHAFSLSNAGLGVLAGAVSIAAAAGTVPAGTLVDRIRRGRVLGAAVATWTLAMLLTGAASSFAMLLAARLFLGAVRAAAAPVSLSLVGDLYRPAERGRIFGALEAGQLAGTGIGFLLAAGAVAALSWRWAFWVLGIVGVVLILPAWRLHEPQRACADLPAGGSWQEQPVEAAAHRSTAAAIWDLLHIRTNVSVIAAAMVADIFATSVAVFGVVFVTKQYGVSTATADLALPVVGIAAVVAVVVGGRLGDALKESGRGAERLRVGALCYAVAAVVLFPVALTHSRWVALPLVMVAAAAITAPSPWLDAIRVDIVHPRLRGRAEALRSLCRAGASALAPVIVGVLSTHLAGGGHAGLRDALMVVLPVALFSSGGILLLARRFYDSDIEAMTASLVGSGLNSQQRPARPAGHEWAAAGQ